MDIRTLPFSLLFIGMIFTGCSSPMSKHSWCTISAKEYHDEKSTIEYSILLQEHKGELKATVLTCGDSQFLLKNSAKSSSQSALPEGYLQSDFGWNGRMSCTDVTNTYPRNSHEAMTLLKDLCAAFEEPADIEPVMLIRPRKKGMRLDVRMKRLASPYPRNVHKKQDLPTYSDVLREMFGHNRFA